MKRNPSVFFAVFFLSACATTPLDFAPIAAIQPGQTVELTYIDDFERLINDHRIKVVYYTSDYFVVNIHSALYLLKSRGYTNFHDYKEGKLAQPEEYSIFKPGYSLKRL